LNVRTGAFFIPDPAAVGIEVSHDAQRERGRTGIERGARNAEIGQDVAHIVAADFGAGPQSMD
jgi:hypothetical protein